MILMKDKEMESQFYKNDLLNFIKKFYSDFDKSLLDIIKEADKREGVNPTVNREVGSILKFITNLVKPKKVLDLGTCLGVSSIIFAKNMLKDGIVYTVDKRADLISDALNNYTKFDLNPNMKPLLGDVEDIIPKFVKEKKKFDIIFQDSGKKSYPKILDCLIKLLNKNGLLITDDVLLEKANFPEHIKGIDKAVKKHNDLLLNDNRIESIFIPLEDGLVISRKI